MAKWKQLKHNGVSFPPSYHPKGFKLTVRGEVINPIPELAEEMAYAWGRKKDTPYVKDPVFQANFLGDFTKLLPSKFQDARIEEIDFSEIHSHIEEEKTRNSQPEVKKSLAAERKRSREELKARFGQAEVDGKIYDVANWMVEPPGLFMGRGEHPLRGRWKPRVYPEDVTLNLEPEPAKNPPFPPLPYQDRKWGAVVSDRESTWLAKWIDKLSGDEKYVWLSDSAKPRQLRDKRKYDLAVRLETQMGKVRAEISKAMRSGSEKERKVAIVAYLIDRLAMRVGDEKDKDEADTVGASTLRVEHITLTPEKIYFDFLGKDSVRWQKSIELKEENPEVFENFKAFIKGKMGSDLLFDGVRSRDVNRFLGEVMKGLTAKAFRTYLATSTVKSYLAEKDNVSKRAPEFEKLYHARMANLRAAETCNHKRSPPKNWEERLEKKKEFLKQLEAQQPKTEKQKGRLEERREKLRLNIDLAFNTKDYNLGTSLKNYIDPRVYKAWSDSMGLDWEKIYTKALQRKFQWVARSSPSWSKIVSETQ